MNRKTSYRADIQALRGFSVLIVVLFHADEKLFPMGYLGVDIFFVISGFVVTPLIIRIFEEKSGLKSRLSNLTSFYRNRFFRLAPALGVTLIFSTLILFIFGSPADHERFVLQGIATIFLLGNLGAYKYQGDYFSTNPNPLVHTWSLSVEEQIYVLLPMILLLFLHNRKRIYFLATALLTIIGLMSVYLFLFPSIMHGIYARAGVELASQFDFYSPFHRMWEFCSGGLVFLVSKKFGFRDCNHLFVKVLLIILLLLSVFVSFQASFQMVAVLCIFFVSSILYLGAFDLFPNFIKSPLVWIGDRSYSIYLLHMPLLYIAKYSPLIPNHTFRMLLVCIAVCLSVILGSISFSRVENRFRNLGRLKTRGVVKSLVVLLVFVAIPLMFLLFMLLGSRNQYWGLDKNQQRPSYAGFLDPDCERDTRNGPPCVYNSGNSSKTLMLIGDSHAGMISEAFVNAATRNSVRAIVWTHSGCRFQLQSAHDLHEYCVPINSEILSFIVQERPDAILVSQALEPSYDLKPLQEAIVRLTLHARVVAILGDTPVFPDSDVFMVPNPVLFPPKDIPKKIQRNLINGDRISVSTEMDNWARQNNVDVISPYSLFCTTKFCNRWSTKGWLYRDASHLSTAGADLIVPMIAEWIERISK